MSRAKEFFFHFWSPMAHFNDSANSLVKRAAHIPARVSFLSPSSGSPQPHSLLQRPSPGLTPALGEQLAAFPSPPDCRARVEELMSWRGARGFGTAASFPCLMACFAPRLGALLPRSAPGPRFPDPKSSPREQGGPPPTSQPQGSVGGSQLMGNIPVGGSLGWKARSPHRQVGLCLIPSARAPWVDAVFTLPPPRREKLHLPEYPPQKQQLPLPPRAPFEAEKVPRRRKEGFKRLA